MKKRDYFKDLPTLLIDIENVLVYKIDIQSLDDIE